MSGTRATVGIVGGGPAGSSLAIRLRRLGHTVLIVTDGRCRHAVQGLSERAIVALRELDAPRASATIGAPASRLVLWNGIAVRPNDECLIDRRAFDQALLTEARELGASIALGCVARKPLPASGPLEIAGGDGARSVSAEVWIEARGRPALHYGRPTAAGPATLTLQQPIQSTPGLPWSAVFAVPDGWCWVGMQANGRGIVQRSLQRDRGRLPVRTPLDLLRPPPLEHPALEDQLKAAHPTGRVQGFPTERALDVGDPSHLRVGDAQNAPDPLSGHGVCEAIASSRNVAAAVNTLLRRPESAALAHRFVADRARERFRILGALGRHSYCQEERWMTHAFWLERRAEPESTDTPAPAKPEIRQTAVLDHDEIVLRDVLIVPRHPRGVWRVHEVPVVDLLAEVRAGNTPEAAAARLRVSPLQAARAMQWLDQQGIP